MKKFIVTTSINSPTKAIEKFDAMEDWHLIVIGDLKTPTDYKLKRGTYVPPSQQSTLGFNCVEQIPWNVIQRRNIGYLLALKEGADVIATVDDDNIPLPNWGHGIEFPMRTERPWYRSDLVVDPLYVHECDLRNRGYPSLKLWHRGFPVQLLEERWKHDLISGGPSDIDVVADLWNGDPDVDAVCRIAHGPFDLFFSGRETIMESFAPYNTQNTFFTRRVAPCMCLPFDIGRMDDIWASYMTQRVMRQLKTRVLFRGPSVFQDRNVHDLSKDLEKELIGYRHTIPFLERLKSIEVRETGSVLQMYTDVVCGIYGLPFITEEMYRFQRTWIDDVSRFI